MDIRSYLPSAQFTLLVLAVAFSAGLVWAAQRSTNPPAYRSGVSVNPLPSTPETAWKEKLLSLAGSSTPPQAPVDVGSLISAARSENLTESVGRTLLLNLSDAQSENRANDEGAQLDILTLALNEAGTASAKTYALQDLKLAADSSASLRAYGNAVMAAVRDHKEASWGVVISAVGGLVDGQEARSSTLAQAAEAYRALTEELAALPVPQSLAPLHLRVLNDFSAEAEAGADMAALRTDPLRGLRGFQNYQTLALDVVSVFTTIGASLAQGGILFTKDEPGYSWNLLKASAQ